MRPRGFTLVEAMLGIAVAAVVGLVSARLFQAGLKTYQFSVRQGAALAAGAAAMRGEGARQGMLPTARAAKYVQSLSATSLALVSPTSVVTTFYVSSGTLLRTQSPGTTLALVSDVGPLSVNYYNIDGAGLIAESTVTALATMVTFSLGVKGLPSSGPNILFSGAQLRNHP